MSDFCISDVIMSAMASQITGDSIVFSTVFSSADQRKNQSPALLALCEGNPLVTHHWLLWREPTVTGGFPSVSRIMFPFHRGLQISIIAVPGRGWRTLSFTPRVNESPPLGKWRQNLQTISLEANLSMKTGLLPYISIKVWYFGCDWWEASIVFDNGLAPNRRQANMQATGD